MEIFFFISTDEKMEKVRYCIHRSTAGMFLIIYYYKKRKKRKETGVQTTFRQHNVFYDYCQNQATVLL